MSRLSNRRRANKTQNSSETLDRDRLLRELEFDNRPLRFSLLIKPVYFTILVISPWICSRHSTHLQLPF